MKMRPPLNSTLPMPLTGIAGFSSARKEANKIPGRFQNAMKRCQLVTLALLTGFPF
jgi:hypothetical protein